MLALALFAGNGHAASADASADPSARRFHLEGGAYPVTASSDGRFALSASVRAGALSASSADARYVLKAFGASCAPRVDLVFRDGFE